MTGCLAGRARAFGATSCFTASARSAPGTRPGRDMLTTLPPGEGSSHYVHAAIKSRSLNGHGADLADTPGTWTCTALFGGILYCEPCGDLEHGETSGADHGYESYTRTACAAEIFVKIIPAAMYRCRARRSVRYARRRARRWPRSQQRYGNVQTARVRNMPSYCGIDFFEVGGMDCL